MIFLSDERNRRRDIFAENVEIIKQGQFEFDNGLATYDLKVNDFTDLTFEEFANRYLGQGQLGGDDVFIDPNIDPEQFTQRIVRSGRRDYNSFPSHLDWRGEFRTNMSNFATYIPNRVNVKLIYHLTVSLVKQISLYEK